MVSIYNWGGGGALPIIGRRQMLPNTDTIVHL